MDTKQTYSSEIINQKVYTSPELEVIAFDYLDVITTSLCQDDRCGANQCEGVWPPEFY